MAYHLANVFRGWRRSVYVFIGLSLAVVVVATPIVALDSEVRALVGRMVDSLPFDYYAQGASPQFENESRAVAAVDEVLGAEPIVFAPLAMYAAPPASPVPSAPLAPVDLVFVQPSFSQFASHFGLAGSFDLQPSDLAISDRLAGRLGMVLGSTIMLVHVVDVCPTPSSCMPENATANFTVASILSTPLDQAQASGLGAPLGQAAGQDVAFAAFSAIAQDRAILRLPVGTPPSGRILIWADTNRVIDPYDAAAAESNALDLERSIEIALVNSTLVVGEAANPSTGATLSTSVLLVANSTGFQRGILLLLSFPTLALGYVFTRIGFEIGLRKRRHEMGILRSRGTSQGLLLGGLVVEALTLGAIAGLVGFAASLVVSRFFLGFVNASLGGGTAIPFSDVAVSLPSALIVVTAAFSAAFLVAYPSARQISEMRIVRALKQTSRVETATDPLEARWLLGVALGLAGLLVVLGLLGSGTQGGVLRYLIGTISVVLIVLAPLILLLGVARYLTTGTDRPYRWLAHIVQPWTRDLHFLVVAGLQRNARRSSNLAVIVAFALAFAIFVVSLGAVIAADQQRVAETAVGGDLAFSTTSATWADLDGVGAWPGVASVSPVDFIPSDSGLLVGINASEYVAVAPWVDAYYFSEGSSESLSELVSDGGVIANEAMSEAQGLHAGSRIAVQIATTGGRSGGLSFTYIFQVLAVVRALPGLQPNGASIDSSPALIVDVRSLDPKALAFHPPAPEGLRLLVRMNAGADPNPLAKALEQSWSGNAVTLSDVLAAQRDDPFLASLIGQLYTEAGLAVAVAVASVSSMAFASSAERENEFATMLARGLDRGRLVGLLFGEGVAVAILGAAIAVPVVLVFLWAFLQLLSTLSAASLPLEFVVPPVAWVLIAACLGAVAIGSLLAGLALKRMDLPSVLKIRGM